MNSKLKIAQCLQSIDFEFSQIALCKKPRKRKYVVLPDLLHKIPKFLKA